mgnify:CR=1 FL=1
MWPFKSKIKEPIEPPPCLSCVELKTHLENREERLTAMVMENIEIPSLRQSILSLKADLLKQKREQTEADLLLVSVKIIKSILDTGNSPPTQLMNQQAELRQSFNILQQRFGPILSNIFGSQAY